MWSLHKCKNIWERNLMHFSCSTLLVVWIYNIYSSIIYYWQTFYFISVKIGSHGPFIASHVVQLNELNILHCIAFRQKWNQFWLNSTWSQQLNSPALLSWWKCYKCCVNIHFADRLITYLPRPASWSTAFSVASGTVLWFFFAWQTIWCFHNCSLATSDSFAFLPCNQKRDSLVFDLNSCPHCGLEMTSWVKGQDHDDSLLCRLGIRRG